MPEPKASRRIEILREEVANRIAAGEVIDRPLSIVRELLDNALDAGARSIDVWIERGGLDAVRVADDGTGMDRADLELCYLPHATSKITTVDDLGSAATLGFRGEALSSIGVSATLEVVSRTRDKATAWRLTVRDGRQTGLEACPGNPGTDVRVSGLFAHQPARRQFLRSPAAESAQCATAFLDRAVAFPEIGFRLFTNGSLRHFLPPTTAAERVGQAYPELVEGGLSARTGNGPGFSVCAVLARPEAARRDRRMVQIFVNGRRIWEYALVQALEYGFSTAMPGGLHPVGFVFITLDPALADFNIHPAKREARFRDLPSLHRAVVALAKEHVAAYTPPSQEPPRGTAGLVPEPVLWTLHEPAFRLPPAAPNVAGGVADAPARAPADRSNAGVTCYGQVFGLFLIAERAGILYLIDQHAAHERILFDRMMREPPTVQELLLPISFDVSEAELRQIDARRAELEGAGVMVRTGPGSCCEVTALDERLRKIREPDLVETIRGRQGEPGSIRRELCSLAACRSAVRDGEPLDLGGALDLATQALALPVARCPHGRPVWHALSRADLYRLVKRTV